MSFEDMLHLFGMLELLIDLGVEADCWAGMAHLMTQKAAVR
jgi:hypothetical protein